MKYDWRHTPMNRPVTPDNLYNDKGLKAFTQEEEDAIILEILSRIAEGELLSKVCEDEHLPSTSWFYYRISKNRDLAVEYKRARKIQAMRWCDSIVEIADSDDGDKTTTGDGREQWDYQHIQRSKLRIGVRQWLIKSALPELFNEQHNQPDEARGVTVDKPEAESREQWLARQEERIAKFKGVEVEGVGIIKEGSSEVKKGGDGGS